MKSKFEFQLDRLDAFRFALSRMVRKQRQSGEAVHGLALRVGAWPDEKYAPLSNGKGSGVLRYLVHTGFVPPFSRGLEWSRKAATQIEVYPPQAPRLESKIRYARLSRKVRARSRAAVALKHEAASYSGLGIRGIQFRVALVRGRRSFAPPPVGGAPRLGLVRAEMRAQTFPGKIYGSVGKDELIPPLPEEIQLAGEGRSEQRKSTAQNVYEGRVNLGFSASNSGSAFGGDFSDMLEEYFFQRSRLAPSGGAAFDPRLSPLWPGLKLPG